MDLRTEIGRYLRQARAGSTEGEPSEAEYELLVEHARNMQSPGQKGRASLSAFAFEDFAQNWSTFFFCALVLAWSRLAPASAAQSRYPFAIAGAVGMIATLVQWKAYRRRMAAINELSVSR